MVRLRLGLPVFAIVLGVSHLCAQLAPQSLMIAVIVGEGQTNNVRQRTAREPIVEVRDQDNRPVAGASVLFLLPQSGPSGAFANNLQTLTVVTDSRGRATARGFRPNSTTGQYVIQVTATYQGLKATTTIAQINALVAALGVGTTTATVPLKAIVAGMVVTGVTLGTIVAVVDGDEPPVSPSTR